MDMYETVTKEHFLNDIDEIIRYFRAYLNGAKINEDDLYPVMGDYISAFGEILRNYEIKTVGNWISRVVVNKSPIVTESWIGPTEFGLKEFTYDEFMVV